MHKASVAFVNASAQSKFSENILPVLTGEERAVWLRGRNASPHHTPKGATEREYHLATALECVFGWLYLRGESERINELFDIITDTSQRTDT
jgi:ribonuclease-3 family protein